MFVMRLSVETYRLERESLTRSFTHTYILLFCVLEGRRAAIFANTPEFESGTVLSLVGSSLTAYFSTNKLCHAVKKLLVQFIK